MRHFEDTVEQSLILATVTSYILKSIRTARSDWTALTRSVLPLLIFQFDVDDRLQFANDAFLQSFSLSASDHPTWSEIMAHCFDKRVGVLIETRNFARWLTSARSRRGKLPHRAFESDLCDGRWLWVTETMQSDGSMLCIACDITELKSSQRSLRQSRDVALRASLTDPLTGISNRTHIFEQMQMRIDQVTKREQQIGVVLMDLDEFKKINDKYGHVAGDRVLKHFTQSVLEMLRHEDGFGRVGGEEFMMIFPRIDATSFEKIVTRIKEVISRSIALPEFPDFRYSCSAGITLLKASDTPNDVYRRVDEAMYAAKAAGRNGVKWAIES